MTGTGTVHVLRAPTANRVYTEAAGALLEAEARWVLGARTGTVPRLRTHRLAGMEALAVTPDAGDDGAELPRLLGSLSGTLGLLAEVPDPAPEAGHGPWPLLRPIDPPALLRHPSDLETIQRYPGRTNEQFTALLVNLAAALGTRGDGLFDGSLRLLDPMCGRGTTLNRALRLGLSPIGAEIDRAAVDAYRTFLGTWLRTHRYRHTLDAGRLSHHGTVLGTRLDVEFAADKPALRAGEGQRLTLLGCDTRRLGDLLPARSVDAIVADLPYGVQHGSHHDGGRERSPLALLQDLAPVWRSLLRDGGGMALAVNRHTLDHAAATAALAAADLHVVSVDGAFRHRVDQSIDRDVLLAVPAPHPRRAALTALGAARPPEETP